VTNSNAFLLVIGVNGSLSKVCGCGGSMRGRVWLTEWVLSRLETIPMHNYPLFLNMMTTFIYVRHISNGTCGETKCTYTEDRLVCRFRSALRTSSR
jgi:hypothetical protein